MDENIQHYVDLFQGLDADDRSLMKHATQRWRAYRHDIG